MRRRSGALSCILVGLLICSLFIGMLPPCDAIATSAPEVDGAAIWSNATFLEAIGKTYPAYRCAGSVGANASSEWILDRFQELGLEAWTEEFEFHGWDLASEPSMEVSSDGSHAVSNATLSTFEAEHFSYATITGGATGRLVLLPMPETSSFPSFSAMGFDPSYWQGIDIQDRIVMVGREVRWNADWESALKEKLREGPEALVFFYSQPWSASWDVMYSASSGGRPLSGEGSYLFDSKIPVGHLDTTDSKWLMGKMAEGNLTAKVHIDSRTGIWTQRNVVACIRGGAVEADRVVISAHYDSVMDPGFCDNALSVATVIEIASQLSKLRLEGALAPQSDILFIAFTGEELGLVGSSYYYHSHAVELRDYRALINIDCLGAGSLVRTGTDEYGGVDLDQAVDQAASKLGISTSLEEGSSDHESFLHPYGVASLMQQRWGISPGISSVASTLPSSISLFSMPLAPTETYHGDIGWIHTARDDSSCCLSSGWVSQQSIGQQGDVVLGVCIELLGGAAPSADDNAPLPPWVSAMAILMVATAAILIAIAVVLRRRHGK